MADLTRLLQRWIFGSTMAQAIQSLRDLLPDNPSYARHGLFLIYKSLAEQHTFLGWLMRSRARKHLRLAIQEHNFYPPALADHARYLYGQGHRDDAIERMREAASLQLLLVERLFADDDMREQDLARQGVEHLTLMYADVAQFEIETGAFARAEHDARASLQALPLISEPTQELHATLVTELVLILLLRRHYAAASAYVEEVLHEFAATGPEKVAQYASLQKRASEAAAIAAQSPDAQDAPGLEEFIGKFLANTHTLDGVQRVKDRLQLTLPDDTVHATNKHLATRIDKYLAEQEQVLTNFLREQPTPTVLEGMLSSNSPQDAHSRALQDLLIQAQETSDRMRRAVHKITEIALSATQHNRREIPKRLAQTRTIPLGLRMQWQAINAAWLGVRFLFSILLLATIGQTIVNVYVGGEIKLLDIMYWVTTLLLAIASYYVGMRSDNWCDKKLFPHYQSCARRMMWAVSNNIWVWHNFLLQAISIIEKAKPKPDQDST